MSRAFRLLPGRSDLPREDPELQHPVQAHLVGRNKVAKEEVEWRKWEEGEKEEMDPEGIIPFDFGDLFIVFL